MLTHYFNCQKKNNILNKFYAFPRETDLYYTYRSFDSILLKMAKIEINYNDGNILAIKSLIY